MEGIINITNEIKLVIAEWWLEPTDFYLYYKFAILSIFNGKPKYIEGINSIDACQISSWDDNKEPDLDDTKGIIMAIIDDFKERGGKNL